MYEILDAATLAVYRTVLFHGKEDSKELAQILGCLPHAVEESLERLRKMWLLAPSREEPGKLRAVPPEFGISVLIEREKRELAWRQHCIEQNRAALSAIGHEYAATGRSHVLSRIEVIDSQEDLQNRVEGLMKSCSEEFLVLQNRSSFSDEFLTFAQPFSENVKSSGARFRAVYLDSVTNNRSAAAHVQSMAECDVEVRTAPALPVRMVVVDSKTALVAGLPGQESWTTLLFSCLPVVLSLRALFEACWEHSTPLDGPAPLGPSELTPQEHKVLRLLAKGLTDEAVARSLGVGLRTERRIVADLMERLNASSRFEAGVEAARRRWL